VAGGDGRMLTDGEERIALLAARGRRNHEIAAALGMSPKTVEWNLTRIYRKLGVRSRTELAALDATRLRAKRSE
jgi:DNA-binding CsgD family transcriptional regulator